MKHQETAFYYLTNYRGDVLGLTDKNGQVVAEYTYDAWGNIFSQSGVMAKINPYRYAGYRYDEATKLYYLMARYYNPNTGVFLSLDPVRGDTMNPITMNGYNYANNNPVMNVDPDGEWAFLYYAVIYGYNSYKIYKLYKSAKNAKKTGDLLLKLDLQYFSAKKGMNNIRFLNNYKKSGYNISLDLERGGSGLTNIHLKVNNTKYFYNFSKDGFFSTSGKSLPNSIAKDSNIKAALVKALKRMNSGW